VHAQAQCRERRTSVSVPLYMIFRELNYLVGPKERVYQKNSSSDAEFENFGTLATN
jgi:hypothetical protein